ncbi:MAG: NUDIX hydrolase [Candidatus Promineifilaceae bacterium]|jgi:8-oxo-dGTP pyrophosphatase MutT (NUDIX family)
MPATISQIRRALELNDFDALAAQYKMAPVSRVNTRPEGLEGAPRLGGVLLLLFCKGESLHVLLTRRCEDLASHAGQISFPGGRKEAAETLLDTALRETEEEVGIAAAELEILGALTPIYIPPSDYEVHPFVAWFNNGRLPEFNPAPWEVAEIIEVPLAELLDPAVRIEELWEIRGQKVLVPFFAVQDHKVWGATAAMLSEFIERLRVVLHS